MDFDALYLRALKFLSYRPRSEKEIRDYLQKKLQKFSRLGTRFAEPSTNADGSVVDLIIHKLKQQRFLDDKEFAKMWVRSRTQFRPKGKYLVALELKQKGIAQDIIDEVLDSDVRTQSEEELATEVLSLKMRKYASMEVVERFNKAGSMLARRGFSLDAIKGAIDAVFGKML